MPKAGGQYVYLNEAYGPLWGFLYGWSAITVINTASIAAIGVAFAEYLGYFFPFSTLIIKGIAVLTIILLTILNIIDVKSGARFQNIFTMAKLAAIIGIIILGITMEGGSINNFSPLISDKSFSSMIGPLGLAMIAVLWTFDGWIFVTYVASEIKDPGRNLPLSILYCIIIVMTIYISINYVLVYTLGFEKMMSSNLVMSDAASVFLGNSGAAIVTIIILISLVGSNNGFILTSARTVSYTHLTLPTKA